MNKKTQVIIVLINALSMIAGGVVGGPIMDKIVEKYSNQHEENESIKLKNKVKELEVKLTQLQTENSRLKNENVGLTKSLEKQPQKKTQEVSAELSRLRSENAILKQRLKDLGGYRQPIQVIKLLGVTFELESCRVVNNTDIHCTFLITNTGNSDIDVRLYLSSMIFDNAGREYTASKIKIGNRDNSRYDSASQTLPAGVKTKANVIFDVSSSTALESQIQLFRFVYSVSGRASEEGGRASEDLIYEDSIYTDFPNIPIGEKE